jgi:hypothetical protein
MCRPSNALGQDNTSSSKARTVHPSVHYKWNLPHTLACHTDRGKCKTGANLMNEQKNKKTRERKDENSQGHT